MNRTTPEEAEVKGIILTLARMENLLSAMQIQVETTIEVFRELKDELDNPIKVYRELGHELNGKKKTKKKASS